MPGQYQFFTLFVNMERFFLYSVISFLLLEDNLAVPTTQMVEDPELTGGFTEGDMILPAQQRNGMRSQIYRWPDGKVFYHIGGNIGRFCRKNQVNQFVTNSFYQIESIVNI